MKKLVSLLVFSLLVICGGFLWGIYDYKSAHNLSTSQLIGAIKGTLKKKSKSIKSKKPSSAKVSKTPQPPVTKKPEPPKEDSKPVAKRSKEPKETKTPVLRQTVIAETLAKRVIKEAETSYRKLDFDGALKKLNHFSDKEMPAAFATRTNELRQKCEAFKEILAEVSPEEIASFKPWVEVTLITGRVLEGQLVRETKKSLKIKRGNIEKELSLNTRVDYYKKLTPREYQAKCRKEYEEECQRLGKNASVWSYYQLALDCYKDCINDGTLAMLEKAWDKDSNLTQALKEEKAKQFYETYLFLVEHGLSKRAEKRKAELKEKYPNSKYVALVEMSSDQSSSDEPTDPVVIDPVSPNDPEWGKHFNEAERYYKKGRVYLEKTFEKGPGFKKHNKLAGDYFRKALKIYQGLESTNSNNESISARIDEITRLLIHIRKQRVH